MTRSIRIALFFSFLLTFSILSTCSGERNKSSKNSDTTLQQEEIINTKQRSLAAEKLFNNLKNLSASGKIMFGMANPTTIGYSNGPKNSDINQSDCKDILGTHPAFHESDFMWYEDESFKKNDILAMRNAYERGAVCGYCWHFRGMQSHEFYAKKDGRFTEDKDLVKNILASSDRNTNKSLDWFLDKIDTEIIPVFKELDFPLVFRPFHEMNGNWFWWGTDNCTSKEYIRLYRLTVDYLRNKGIKNLLYAWSVNVTAAFEFYPGDEYVDILGLDSYEPGIAAWNNKDIYIGALQSLTDSAYLKGKVAALTETGCRKENGQFRYTNQFPDFWTKYILYPIINDKKAKRIVWIMSWYSADWNHDLEGQYYIPYKDMKTPNAQEAIDDFRKFYNSPVTLFEDDLQDMYK